MRKWQNQNRQLQRELSYFVRVRNRYTRIALGFWKWVFVWIISLGTLAAIVEVFELLSRRGQ